MTETITYVSGLDVCNKRRIVEAVDALRVITEMETDAS